MDPKKLTVYFKSKSIHHDKTNAYTPQENGIAERINRTIVEMACTLLSGANISIIFWCFAVIYTAYIINQSPTHTLKNNQTPFKAYTGNKPTVMHLWIFGCKAYVHIPHGKHQKLDKKTLECVHLGYSEHKKAFMLLHHSSGNFIKSRDVHFDKIELVEPSQIWIETEATKNKEGVDILPDQGDKETDFSTASSEDPPKNLKGNSDDNDNKNKPDIPLDGPETTEESSSCAISSSVPDNSKRAPASEQTVSMLNQLHQQFQQPKKPQKRIKITSQMQELHLQKMTYLNQSYLIHLVVQEGNKEHLCKIMTVSILLHHMEAKTLTFQVEKRERDKEQQKSMRMTVLEEMWQESHAIFYLLLFHCLTLFDFTIFHYLCPPSSIFHLPTFYFILWLPNSLHLLSSIFHSHFPSLLAYFHIPYFISMLLCSISIFITTPFVHYSLPCFLNLNNLIFYSLWLCKSSFTFSVLHHSPYYSKPCSI